MNWTAEDIRIALDDRLCVAKDEYASSCKNANKLFAAWQKAEGKADQANLVKTPELESCEAALAAARSLARIKSLALDAAEEDVRKAVASGQDIFLRTLLIMRESEGLQYVPGTESYEDLLQEILKLEKECEKARANVEQAHSELSKALSERPENVRRTPETMEADEALREAREAEEEACQNLKGAEEDLYAWAVRRICKAHVKPCPQDEIFPARAARVFLALPAA